MPWASDHIGALARRWGSPALAGVLAGLVTGSAGCGAPRRRLRRRCGADLRGRGVREVTRRIEAIATWTELLRDTLVVSAGLAQSIVASAQVAPIELRDEVSRLADRIVSGMGMGDALRAFADEVADPSADLVVCALVLASEARAQRLSELLSALASSIREEVSMRLRIEAGRSATRSSVRTIVIFSLGFAAFLAVAARAFLAPFATATGQLVLVAVAGAYLAGIWLMGRLVRTTPAARLLDAGGER